MKFLCVFLLVAIVAAARHPQIRDEPLFHAGHLRSAALTLQSLSLNRHESIPNIENHVAQLQADDITCGNAWVNLSDILQSRCGQITDIYQPDLSGVNVTQEIIDHCVTLDDATGKTCHQMVTTAIVAVSNECNGRMGGLDANARAALAMWLTISKVSCVMDAATLCFPVFRQTVDTFTAIDNGAPVTDDILDTVCVPCVQKVLNLLATWGLREFVEASATLKIACLKRGGEYCMPKFLLASSTVQNFSTPENRDLACHECTILIAYRLYWANVLFDGNQTQRADLLKYLQYAGFICQMSGAQYCTVILQQIDYSPIGTNCALQFASPLTAATTCPGSSCQDALMSIKRQAGCCLGTWMNYLEFVYQYYPDDYPMTNGVITLTPDTVETALEDWCDVPIGSGCATKRVKLALVINNIIEGWYLQNKAWLEARLEELVAYVLAVDTDSMVDVATSWDAIANAVKYEVTIVPADNNAVNMLQDNIKNVLQMTDDTNAILVNIKDPAPETQAADFDSAITVSASSVVECSDNQTCFACGLGPSLSLLFALTLLLSYLNH